MTGRDNANLRAPYAVARPLVHLATMLASVARLWLVVVNGGRLAQQIVTQRGLGKLLVTCREHWSWWANPVW